MPEIAVAANRFNITTLQSTCSHMTIVSLNAAPISDIIVLATTSSSPYLLTLDVLSFECITTHD
jgi:hypothetical protein